MPHSRRQILQTAAALTATTSFSSWAQPAATPVRGGTLIAVINPEPAQLHTAFHNQYANSVVGANLFDGLVVYDDQQKPQPLLAKSWAVSADGLSITFRLQERVKWHDGKDFTSADVKYSALEIWKKLHPRARVTFAPLIDVETPDALTVILRLERPAPVILSALNFAEAPILPQHLYRDTDVRTNAVNRRPVGTGPFRFKEWKKGEYIELERNPGYWQQGKPYLDRVIFRTIPDAAGRAAALEIGEVQYLPYAGVPLADITRLRQNPKLAFETRGYGYGAQLFFFQFNLRRPNVDNAKVRQAIAHALDKKGLIDTVWYGASEPADSVVPKSLTAFYAVDKPVYDYNLQKAERLLDEADLPRKANGTRFTVTLDLSVNGPEFAFAGEFIRQNLAKVGIDARPVLTEQGAFMKRIWSDYNFDILFQGFSILMDPEMGLTRMVWSKAASPGVPNVNASNYASPAVDKLIDAYSKELDPRKRAGYFHEVQRVLLTDLPLLPVMEAPYFTFYDRHVHGLDLRLDGIRSSLQDVWLAP